MAGGWRKYVAARRMQYVLIRLQVSKTYAVLPEDHEDRALLHFLFGCNRDTVEVASGEDDQAADPPTPMATLPDDLFPRLLGFLAYPSSPRVRYFGRGPWT